MLSIGVSQGISYIEKYLWWQKYFSIYYGIPLREFVVHQKQGIRD